MKIATLDTLSLFLSKLKAIFSSINHKHTVSDVDNLLDTITTLQDNVDVLEKTVADLAENINPEVSFKTETWNFTLIDGTTASKQVMVK